MIECYNCGTEYPPTATRWRCPSCGAKDTCCEGAPAGRTPLAKLERPRKPRNPKFDSVIGEYDVD